LLNIDLLLSQTFRKADGVIGYTEQKERNRKKKKSGDEIERNCLGNLDFVRLKFDI
jgi:hypothetical protein